MRTYSIVTLACLCGALSACSSETDSGSQGTTPGGGTGGGGAPPDGGGGGGGGGGGAGGTGGVGGVVVDAGDDAGVQTVCHVVGGEVRVTSAPGASTAPSLVWTGQSFLIAFADDRTGGGDIYVAELDSTGQKTGPEQIVAGGAAVAKMPSLVKSAGGLMLAWQSAGTTGTEIRALPLDAEGKAAQGATPALVASSMAQEARPFLAQAMGGLALAWADGSATAPSARLATLAADGTVSAGPIAVGPGGQSSTPDVAGSEQQIAGAWSQKSLDHVDVHVATYGLGIGLQQDVSVRSGVAGDATNSHITSDGAGYWVAWEDLRSGEEEIFGSHVSPDGVATMPLRLHAPASGSANWPSLAGGTNATGVAYYQFRSGPPQIFLALVAPDGARIGEEMQVSNAPTGKARFPSIVATPDGWAIAWEDTRNAGDPEIYFARLACP